MSTTGHGEHPHSLKGRAVSELKAFILLTIYLYVAFSALIMFKAGVMREAGESWSPWGLALIKSLLVAKFMLVGKAVHAGERFRDKPLIWQTVYRSLVFLAFVLVLTVIEEAIVGLIHHKPVWEAVSEIGGGNLTEFLATLAIVFLIFFPYFAFQALGEITGAKPLFALFLKQRRNVTID